MTMFKEVIEYLDRWLLKTERIQALFYWILISVTIVCCIFINGIALPMILIVISGVAVYYVCLMIGNAKNKAITSNNELMKNCISDLSEKIINATYNVKDQIDTHNNETNENILRLVRVINDQSSQITKETEKRIEENKIFIEETSKQNTKNIIEVLIEHKNSKEKLSKSNQDVIIAKIKEIQDLALENYEKTISAGLSNQKVIFDVINSHFKQLATSQADIKDHADHLMKEIQINICDTLDAKVNFLSANIENNVQMKLSEIANKIIETVEVSDEQMKIAVCDNIRSCNDNVCNEIVLNSNKLADVGVKISELMKDFQSQKASLSNDLDILTNEIIKCVTNGLGNYSEKILNGTDESTNYIKKLVESMAEKIESVSESTAKQAEFAKLELSKVHAEINLLEQAYTGSQNNNLDVLNKQEQIWGDIQAITLQLNNVRLLLKSVKLNVEARNERKGNIEIIEDKENDLKIKNTYDGEFLRKSEMYKECKLKYYVEYDKDGKINYSQNHDLNGNILTEIYYYPNEQVKERIEWTNQNGRAIKNSTYFDKQGNIKK